MKRKTSTIPSKVYTYGCLPPRDPAQAKLIDEQIFRAHRYRNKLIEIELARRAQARAAQSARPEVSLLEDQAKDLESRLDGLRTAIKATNKAARARVETADTQAAKVQAKLVLAELRLVRTALKAAKVEARQDTVVKAMLAAANATATVAIKAARGECGVYWGTYLLVERAIEQAKTSSTDPRFMRYTGNGRVGVQLQGGLKTDDLATDTRLQIQPVPPETWTGNRGQRRRLSRTNVRIRVGSDGRNPIWVELPMVMHRPLPAGEIKWAWIKRVREGVIWRYDLQVTIESPSFIPVPAPGHGTAAIDLGWRLRKGGVRVGFLADDSGKAEEMLLPGAIAGALAHADSLRAIRDLNFNKMRDQLVAWLATLEQKPEFLGDVTKLAMWRSPGRLTKLALSWIDHRFPGDEQIFTDLDAWRKQERHLLSWEGHERAKALRRRKDTYRVMAHKISTSYGRVIMEKFDLRRVVRLPEAEQGGAGNQAARHQRQVAAPSEFRGAIIAACAARGVEVVSVDAMYTTRHCHVCGLVSKFDAAAYVTHACPCGAIWDQDDNAARNLLAVASGSVMSPETVTEEPARP